MSHYPESILRLIRNIAKLPGIGEKTAERLALHVLRAPRAEIEALARSLTEVKSHTCLCGTCFGLSDAEICAICSDAGRDDTVLCVVEQPADMVALEKAGAFRGLYHVLQGVLSPMNGIGPDQIRLRELEQRVAGGRIKEVVVATGTSVEGEATGAYVTELLKAQGVKVSRIASGIPMGGDLKYVDQVTLKRAMECRRGMDA